MTSCVFDGGTVAETAFMISFVGIALCVVIEWFAQERDFPRIAYWPAKGAIAAGLFFILTAVVPLAISTSIGSIHLFDLRSSSLVLQALLATLLLQAGVYAWHRTVHGVPWLWRKFHKVHHAPARVDTWGSLYFHPVDVALAIVIQGAGPAFLIRFDPEALGIAGAVGLFLSVFQHTNVRTPHWLGYIVTRPESHCIHHEKGVRGYNYADMAIFDMLFGTFRNPRTWQGVAGL